MIQLVGLGKHFQGRELFRRVDWQIGDAEKIGLTGPNGSGKTTLLRLLAGEILPDEGVIAMPRGTTVGYLPQDGIVAHGRSLADEVRTVFAPLLAFRSAQDDLSRKIDALDADDLQHLTLAGELAEAERSFREGGGFEIDRRMAHVLGGLGFVPADWEKDCGHFSGGWQMRIALAKLLLARPTLLLLDEPTNHLDLEAREWLRDFLHEYANSVILVSHDRYFLDAVVERITEVSPQGLLDFQGGYTRYLVLREEHFTRIRNQNRRIREEMTRLTDLADRFGAKATKAAQAQAWRKQAEKLAQELLPEPPARDTIHFRFPPAPHSGKIVLTLEGVGKCYGPKRVFGKVNLVVPRGAKVALVGVNGAGKSTLMRILAGLETFEGTVTQGHQVVPAYFAQDQALALDPQKSVLDETMADAPFQMVPRLRGLLGSFLFQGDAVFKPVRVLSGGERNRLALVKLLLRPANLLLLDEPTNHLDLDSKDVLLDALQNFEGTIVFVSHDRYFLEQLADHVVHIEGGVVDSYPGGYADYVWRRTHAAEPAIAIAGAAPQAAPRAVSRAPQAPPPAAPAAPDDRAKRVADREAQKEGDRQRKRREKRIAEAEAAVTAAEEALKSLQAQLADPDVYKDGEKAARLTRELKQAEENVAYRIKDWEEAQT